MSYEDSSPAVRLDGADRERAENHTADALKELKELAKLVAQTLGQAGREVGFTRVAIELKESASDEPVDVTVTTFCGGNPPTECLGVYDAVEGVCRPCGPDDHC